MSRKIWKVTMPIRWARLNLEEKWIESDKRKSVQEPARINMSDSVNNFKVQNLPDWVLRRPMKVAENTFLMARLRNRMDIP